MAFLVEERCPTTRERWVSCYHGAEADEERGRHCVQVAYDAELYSLGWRMRDGKCVCPEHAAPEDSPCTW